MATAATLDLERTLHRQGYRFIAGLDEAGRGAWAGPVVAAAVILPPEHPDLDTLLDGVCDSKQLTPSTRMQLAQRIWDIALAVGVGFGAPALIDREGIVPATRHAMMQALRRLHVTPEALVLDYVRLPQMPLPQYAMPRADALHLCVAAASIIAKVTRDCLMVLLAQRYPGYGFAVHKGYGTPDHRRALIQKGITPIHRRSFTPVRALAKQSPANAQLDEFDNREDTC
ncbi:MAG: ribonuclease HII [Anaerolineae bacterium]|nr:ribonuclease HII [Anaerolineae bacterium]MDW8071356.1 ribonuclease HII [Anaerolineae bacterium]